MKTKLSFPNPYVDHVEPAGKLQVSIDASSLGYLRLLKGLV